MEKPDQVLVLEHQLIKLYNESDYRLDSSDNLRSYAEAYLSDDGVCSSLIGVEVMQEDVITASCLIGATGGGTGVHPDAALISYGGLVVCCAATVFKLSLPNLDLAWRTAADSATCFGIYYLDDDYIVHGEFSITRLDRDGKIVWQREGRDIWTTYDGRHAFEVHHEYILATDWGYHTYKYSFDGELLEEYKIEHQAAEKAIPDKKWWEFWKS